jgi:hypothetical protein
MVAQPSRMSIAAWGVLWIVSQVSAHAMIRVGASASS